MLLESLKIELDSFFELERWEPDPAMKRFVPKVYKNVDFDYPSIFEPEFNHKYNGLMLRSSGHVNHVYLAAFPTKEIVDEILKTTKGNSLLFIHHPLHINAGPEGFIPLSPKQVQGLKTKGVSVYSCHAPLDCHIDIGTNSSIVQALKLTNVTLFDKFGNGYAGRVGDIKCTKYGEFLSFIKDIFEVSSPILGGRIPDKISRVAVVAGGGNDTGIMKEAESLCAEAYITGEWYSRLVSSNSETMDWSRRNKKQCIEYAEKSNMTFIGVSHAASEYHVMKTQMKDYFREQGFTVSCLKQTNWWS